MKTRPDYFAWSPEQQERYGAAMPECEEIALDCALFQELFGRSLKPIESAKTALSHLSAAERRRWYDAILPLKGFGRDLLYFTRPQEGGRACLNFATLRALDESAYWHQARWAHGAFAREEYRGELYVNEACLLVDGQLTCAALSMAPAYIYSSLSDVACEVLKEFVPYYYVPGRYHGRVQGKHWIWDLRVKANGQEWLVQELQRRIGEYVLERFEALREQWDAQSSACVYGVDDSTHPEQPSCHFVFSDKSALSCVRLRSFLNDCRALEKPVTELERNIRHEEALLREFIGEQHAGMLKCCDGKVVGFRRRRRIRLTERSLRWV